MRGGAYVALFCASGYRMLHEFREGLVDGNARLQIDIALINEEKDLVAHSATSWIPHGVADQGGVRSRLGR